MTPGRLPGVPVSNAESPIADVTQIAMPQHDEAGALVRKRAPERGYEPERRRNDGQPQSRGKRGIVIAADERKRHREEHPVKHRVGDEHAHAAGGEAGGAEQDRDR